MSRHSRRKEKEKIRKVEGQGAGTPKTLNDNKKNNEPLILNTLAGYSELDTDTQKLLEDYIKYINSKGKYIDSKLVEQWISNHMKVKKTREYNFYFKGLYSIPYPDDIRFTQADRDRLLEIKKKIGDLERIINKGKTDGEIEKAIQEKQILENEMEEIKKRGALNREMEALKPKKNLGGKEPIYVLKQKESGGKKTINVEGKIYERGTGEINSWFSLRDSRVQKYILCAEGDPKDIKMKFITLHNCTQHFEIANFYNKNKNDIVSGGYVIKKESLKIIIIFGKSIDYTYNKEYNPVIEDILKKEYEGYEIRYGYPEYEAEAVDKNGKHFFYDPL